MCHSWLLDPALQTLLPGSNIAPFGARWTPWSCADGDRAALYFGFDIEPTSDAPLPPQGLPVRTQHCIPPWPPTGAPADASTPARA